MRVKLNQVYGEQSKYNFEIGLLAEIFSDFYLGFHIFNPSQEKFETLYFDEAIPTVARFGFSWHLSKETILNAPKLKKISIAIFKCQIWHRTPIHRESSIFD